MTREKLNLRLRNLADADYKKFNDKIITTAYPAVGVRAPLLRKLAAETAAAPGEFFDEFFIGYENGQRAETVYLYESILVYGLALQKSKLSIDKIFHYLDKLIPLFDNWAHTDCVMSGGFKKVFDKNKEQVFNHFLPLIERAGEFERRALVILCMDFYLCDEYCDRAIEVFIKVPKGQYYVDMAVAWALSVGVVKYPDKFIPLIENKVFDRFIHNKAIQKCIESFRVDDKTKAYLRSHKITAN